MNWKDKFPKENRYFETENGILCCGDCLEIMKQFPKESIDMILTSPPYDNLRTYNNTLNWNFDIFKAIAKECTRVLKKGGVIVWIVGDATIKGSETGTSFKQALYFKDECGLNLHDTMIYEKSGIPFPSKVRYNNIFEYMFVFSKGKPKTINLIRDKKNKMAGESRQNAGFRNKDGSFKKTSWTIAEYGIRNNIWRYKTGNNKSTKDKIAFQHPAIFPEKLAEDHIISWSNEGDIILDPFIGSGTTLIACEKLNRKGIGIELNEEYCEIAKQRILKIDKTKTLFD